MSILGQDLSSPHHYVRTILASLIGTLATSLIISSIFIVWLGTTLTSTEKYVDTVKPLVSDPDIQHFAVEKVSGTLVDGEDGPVRDIANELLGPAQVAGKTDEQLREELRPLVEETVQSVVTSPGFAQLWEDTNRSVHSQLLDQLESDTPSSTLDFRPLLSGVIDQLEGTKLAFVQDKVEIKDDMGLLQLKDDNFGTTRDIYNNFKPAIWGIALLALLMTVLAVTVSVHHVKTLQRVAMSTGIFAGLLALGLSSFSRVKPEGSDAEQQKLIVAILQALTQDLKTILIVIAVVCIGGVIVSKVIPKLTQHKRNSSQPTRKK